MSQTIGGYQAALILMDFQRGICGPDGLGEQTGLTKHMAERNVLDRVQRCLEVARSRDVRIVHVGVGFDEGYQLRTNRAVAFSGLERAGRLRLGSDDVAFCTQASPIENEAIIMKGCVNPFSGTCLTQLLTVAGTRDLYLAGVATNFVVESAARHAADSGFNVTVLEDLCASNSNELHEFAISHILPVFATISSSRELIYDLKSTGENYFWSTSRPRDPRRSSKGGASR